MSLCAGPSVAETKQSGTDSCTQIEILILAVTLALTFGIVAGFGIGYKLKACRSDRDDVFYETKAATLQRGRNRLSSGDNHYLQNEPLTPKQMNYVSNLKSNRGSSSDMKPVTKSNKVYI